MKRKLRILHISSSQAWGGCELLSVEIAKNFLDRGHEVIFAAHPKGRTFKETRNSGMQTIPLNFIRHFDPITIVKLVRLIKNLKIDIIHCHLSRDLVHVYGAIKLGGKVPVILHKHVSSELSKKDFFHRRFYSVVSRIIVLSNFVRKSIIDTCPISSDKVIVIPGGVNVSDYDIPPEVRSRIRNEWKIDKETIVIGTVCRIDKAKGLGELVQAFARLNKNGYRTRLIIVGEPTIGGPDYKKQLLSLIKSLYIEKEVMFTGYRSDIPQVLSAFDIFVLASYEEAFGLVLIESLAAKLPVIATRAGGIPDIIEDGVCGLLVPPKDPEGLNVALKKLLLDESLRNKFRYGGRHHVEDRFTNSYILDRIENVYYELVPTYR